MLFGENFSEETISIGDIRRGFYFEESPNRRNRDEQSLFNTQVPFAPPARAAFVQLVKLKLTHQGIFLEFSGTEQAFRTQSQDV